MAQRGVFQQQQGCSSVADTGESTGGSSLGKEKQLTTLRPADRPKFSFIQIARRRKKARPAKEGVVGVTVESFCFAAQLLLQHRARHLQHSSSLVPRREGEERERDATVVSTKQYEETSGYQERERKRGEDATGRCKGKARSGPRL
ncbi:hypothetical protein R1sor_006559 [Riccia sorocarpa]|uniref:Uncharacterized protein n=1 Tax=Riccia sorocarpa TaxID=122646 RepID=A0ABD3HNE2_9MARC